MAYWWDGDPSERYWVEIRRFDGHGTGLSGKASSDPFHQLLKVVAVGDVIYHWHVGQHRFVGRSRVSKPCETKSNRFTVELRGFRQIQTEISLDTVRSLEGPLRSVRNILSESYPEDPLYLPFQYRHDGLRMVNNYFAKLPKVMLPLLFDETGLGEAGALPPPEEDGPVADVEEGDGPTGFLNPFRPKADSNYVTNIQGGPQKKGRTHETLVNDFAKWLNKHGHDWVGRNAAVDLGMNDPPVIVEAKVIGSSWKRPIREAIGQLYEYRYFEVADPQSDLVILTSKTMPPDWLQYLEDDRGIASVWRTSSGFRSSSLAKQYLDLG